MVSRARPELRRPRHRIAVDTNLLVYAHREDMPFHAKAADCLRELWSADRDFGRFAALKVVNPLVTG